MVTYFKNIKQILLKLLTNSQSTIYIAVAWFTDKDILNLLIEKRQKGQKIIVVLSNDDKNFNESYSLDFEPLEAIGGQLIVIDKAFMHHKFSIIDENILVTGSANYTYNGFHKNSENIFVIDDPQTIKEFLNQFKILIDYFEFEAGLVVSDHKANLKKEIEFALFQINFLEQELTEAEKTIELYEVKYRIRFRGLILEILSQQNKILEKKAKITDKWEDKERLNDSKEFYKKITDSEKSDNKKATEILDKSTQKTLKELFREAVKLCHPDNAFIREELKTKAEQIFIKIKEAYSNNDITNLEATLNDLKSGIAFGNINYNEVDNNNLEELLEKLKQKIAKLSEEITTLKSDKRYLLSIDNEALEIHFQNEELLLVERLRMLNSR
jgi:PLD-like domain